MDIIFIENPRDMTHEHYLQQPKPITEWRFNMLLAKNPKLVKIIVTSSHLLIRKYSHLFDGDENQDLF